MYKKIKNRYFKIWKFFPFLFINLKWHIKFQIFRLLVRDSDCLNFIHFSGYKYKIWLVSILRKREDQTLLLISTILKFSAPLIIYHLNLVFIIFFYVGFSRKVTCGFMQQSQKKILSELINFKKLLIKRKMFHWNCETKESRSDTKITIWHKNHNLTQKLRSDTRFDTKIKFWHKNHNLTQKSRSDTKIMIWHKNHDLTQKSRSDARIVQDFANYRGR